MKQIDCVPVKTFLLTALMWAAPATGQEVVDCDWQASAQSIVEPWEDNSRTFANGDVRLALLDTIEPAAGALHLLMLSPPFDEMSGRQCRVISLAPGVGWVHLDFEALAAGYDPAVGLAFTLPGRIYEPEYAFTNAVQLFITLNQSTGAITVEQTLGRD